MKNIENKTLLFYHLQLQKNPSHNATAIDNKGQPITIKDALSSLPFDLSQGIYHFRFKSQMTQGDEKIIAWIDINNLSAKVPMVNGAIYMKILRLKQNNHNKLFTIDKLKKAEIIKFGKERIQQQTTVNNNNSNGITNNTAKPKLVTPTPQPNNHLGSTKPQPINSNSQSTPKTQNQTTAIPSTLDFVSFPKEEVKVPKLITTTVQQNLQTFSKQFQEEEKHKENEKLASLELQQTIKRWGYTNGKIINNTVTLLATLHTIWPQWQQVSLTDMLKPQQVNAMFKKAVIKVHPDKNRNRNFKEKYLSKRVFQLLNQSRKA